MSWAQFATEAPETEAVLRRRVEATGLGLLATIRADGFPRISPIEPLIAADALWLGMMPGSTKVRDLVRDPRLCLHSATEDKDVADGDAKLFGRAIAVAEDDQATRAVYASAFEAATGHDLAAMEGGFNLFQVEITSASALVLGEDGQHLRITTWYPGSPETITKRT